MYVLHDGAHNVVNGVRVNTNKSSIKICIHKKTVCDLGHFQHLVHRFTLASSNVMALYFYDLDDVMSKLWHCFQG